MALCEDMSKTKGESMGHLSCMEEGCIRCCSDRGNPFKLTAGDILRVCRELSIGIGNFYEKYCDIIWTGYRGTCLFIPSIGLVFPCGFLKGGRCEIYDVRPIHCRLFPEALVADNGNLNMYRGCGYKCIDKGVSVDKNQKVFIHRLKDLDRYELRTTASYFENFRYCVELKVEEIERINSLAFEVNAMERAAKKRELFTEAINKKNKEKAEAVFMKKLSKMGTKFPKADDGYLSAISKSFQFLG